ncbi:MAG: class I SAM-dependent methyltransferase [Burkholderiaceae bacterium]|nr:class I SAM-dependent methyltransferase [Burkholderiaceae bacterium]
MTDQPYYRTDLAWAHHVGYAHYVEHTGAGLVRLLRDAGLASGAHVLDVGCGSGLLARKLIDAGFTVHGIDASPAMIELARRHVNRNFKRHLLSLGGAGRARVHPGEWPGAGFSRSPAVRPRQARCHG